MMMNPEQWEQVKQVFGGAVDLPATQRAAFIAGRCSDAEIRAAVESLLGHHYDDGFLEPPAGPGGPVSAIELVERLTKGKEL